MLQNKAGSGPVEATSEASQSYLAFRMQVEFLKPRRWLCRFALSKAAFAFEAAFAFLCSPGSAPRNMGLVESARIPRKKKLLSASNLSFTLGSARKVGPGRSPSLIT